MDHIHRLFGLRQKMVEEMLEGPKGTFIMFEYGITGLSAVYIIVVLEALVKVNFLPSYRRFLLSLALSNFYMTTVNILAFLYDFTKYFLPNITNSRFETCGAHLLRNFQLIGYFALFFNITGMTIDHYIGVLNAKRLTGIAVTTIWIASAVLGFADVPVAGAVYLASLFNYPSLFLKAARARTHDLTQKLFITDSATGYHSGQPASWAFGRTAINPGPIIDDLKRALRIVGAVNGSSPAPALSRFYDDLENIVTHKPGDYDDPTGWCGTYMALKVWLEVVVLVLTSSCIMVLAACYAHIFRLIFNTYRQSQSRLRYSRTPMVVTTCLLLASFAVCWLPYQIVDFCLVIFSDRNAANMESAGALFAMRQLFSTITYCYPIISCLIFANRVRILRRFICTKYCRFFPCCKTCINDQHVRRESSMSTVSALKRLSQPFVEEWTRPSSSAALQPIAPSQTTGSSNNTAGATPIQGQTRRSSNNSSADESRGSTQSLGRRASSVERSPRLRSSDRSHTSSNGLQMTVPMSEIPKNHRMSHVRMSLDLQMISDN